MSIFTAILSRFPDLARDDFPAERLAVAALLVHVARVDGQFDDRERSAMTELLCERFGLPQGAADQLVRRGDELDRDTDDISELIDAMGHDRDPTRPKDLVSMAYRIAAADGRVTEFEEDLVWRVGRLLGFDDDAVAAIRADTLGRSG